MHQKGRFASALRTNQAASPPLSIFLAYCARIPHISSTYGFFSFIAETDRVQGHFQLHDFSNKKVETQEMTGARPLGLFFLCHTVPYRDLEFSRAMEESIKPTDPSTIRFHLFKPSALPVMLDNHPHRQSVP